MRRRDFLKAGTAGLAAVTGTWAFADDASVQQPAGRAAAIDPDSLAEASITHYLPGKRTCAESVLMAGCEALGVRSDLVPDIGLGLAGGVGFQGKTCGALTGAAMVLGIALAPREPERTKTVLRVGEAVRAVCAEFERKFGTTECRELCGLDLTTPEGRKILNERVKAEKCRAFVAETARMLARALRPS